MNSTEVVDVNAYAQLTTQYLVSVENDTTPPDLSAPLKFWGKLWRGVKQFLNADGDAMLKQYQESPSLPITLIIGVASSIDEVTKQEKITIDLGLPDLQVLEEVKHVGNKFDVIGYNHYVVVNNILNDMDQYSAISDVEARDEAIVKRIKKEVAILYPDAQIMEDVVDYPAFYNSLKLQPGESYTEGTAYYDRVFSSNGTKADPAFVQILQLYASSYEAVKEGYIDSFVAYSKTMEQAVQEDKNLTTDVKETLLIGMATYRYGIKYYSNLN
ncbi:MULTISPECIES: hypothetical protein [unclassified Myroides]|uniref:hypothetical protein n=1 Tax=unclassified Myroides TaxID=2642485 RepID=UPI003D2F6CC8